MEFLIFTDSLLAFPYSNNKVGNAFSSIILGSSEADIELSGISVRA